MNLNTSILKKLTRLILFGFSAGILLAISAQPLNLQFATADEGDSGGDQIACNATGTYYARDPQGVCHTITNECIQLGWTNDLSCATPSVPNNPTQVSCDSLVGDYGFCGQRTYDRCILKYSNNGSGNEASYECHSSQNSNCQGTVRCEAQDRNQGSTPPAPAQPAIPPAAPANSQCILGGPNQANYPGPTGSAAWCDCAARNNDAGSLMREGCSQAPKDVDNPSQVAKSCDDFAGNYGVCGQRTYNRCTRRFDGNLAYYDCRASQNGQCQGVIRCSTEDKQTQTNQGGSNQGGGSTAVAEVNCPTGTVPTTGSNQNTVVCVSQAQAQTNNQTQTGGNQTQTGGNQTVVAYGGAGGAGGSANVTVNGAGNGRSGGTRVIYATNGNVGVGTSAGQRVVMVQNYSGVKELPKTGLPALAWASLAFLPAGMRLKRFAKVKEDFSNNPNFLWEQRKFRADS